MIALGISVASKRDIGLQAQMHINTAELRYTPIAMDGRRIAFWS
jgi:hypothetical protein